MSEKEPKNSEAQNNTRTPEDPAVQNEATAKEQSAAAEEEHTENSPDDTTSGAAEPETSEMEKIQADLADLKDQNLRLYAEFENFRKRTARERMDLYRTANRELMEALLPVLDDFQRAMKAQEDEKAREGFALIYNKLENTLKNKGLKPMEDTTGKKFDVETMEAITRISAPHKKEIGKVIDEVERGYMLGDKILRYAKVVVGE